MVMVFSSADAKISLKSFKSSSPSKSSAPVSPAPAPAAPAKAASDKSTLSTAAGAAVGATAGRAVGSAVAAGTSSKPSTTTPAAAPIKDIATTKAALLNPETFTYTPLGKSDPFKPFIETDIKSASAEGRVRSIPLSPLQRLDVEQFTLVGIAGSPNRRVAMVEDKMNKKFYPVTVGTAIGKNSGKVVDILADRVIVDEKGTVFEGSKIKPKRIIMRLSRDEVKP